MTGLRQAFIDGMSHAASTVSIVATDGPAGRAGVTVSAMSSVSADTSKPTLLVCVNQSSAAAAPIIENGTFTVNILRDNQVKVSDTFAGRYGHSREAKFDCADWSAGETGSPMLDDALSNFDCRLVSDQLVGTHHIFMGEVEQVRNARAGRALVYASRSYRAIANLPKPFGKDKADGVASRLACLNTIAQTILPDILRRHQQEFPSEQVEIWDSDQDEALMSLLAGDAELALAYDRDVPESLLSTPLAKFEPYIVLPEGHSLLQQEEVSLQDLADDPLILLETPASRDYFISVFSNAGIKPNFGMSVRSLDLVRSLVAGGLGYSILVTPNMGVGDLSCGKVQARPIKGSVEPIDLVLLERKGADLSGPAKALRKSICNLFQAS